MLLDSGGPVNFSETAEVRRERLFGGERGGGGWVCSKSELWLNMIATAFSSSSSSSSNRLVFGHCQLWIVIWIWAGGGMEKTYLTALLLRWLWSLRYNRYCSFSSSAASPGRDLEKRNWMNDETAKYSNLSAPPTISATLWCLFSIGLAANLWLLLCQNYALISRSGIWSEEPQREGK